MTSKSEGCEAYAKLLHNLRLLRSPSKADILHMHAHTHKGSTPFLAFFFLFGRTGKTSALKRRPIHTHVTHTRQKTPFEIVQLESFFFSLSAAPAYFLSFFVSVSHVSAFLAHTTTM